MDTHTIELSWLGGMQFTSTNPSGEKFLIDAPSQYGGNNQGMHPKALMLSALGGCSGLDIAYFIKQKHLKVDKFDMKLRGELSQGTAKTYTKVIMEYHFFGNDLQHQQIETIVKLSIDKYCGVLKMFESFAQIETEIFYNQ